MVLSSLNLIRDTKCLEIKFSFLEYTLADGTVIQITRLSSCWIMLYRSCRGYPTFFQVAPGTSSSLPAKNSPELPHGRLMEMA